jgi:hypothetical protein
MKRLFFSWSWCSPWKIKRKTNLFSSNQLLSFVLFSACWKHVPGAQQFTFTSSYYTRWPTTRMNMQHQLSSAELLFDISLRLMGAERYGNPRGGVSLFSPDENEKRSTPPLPTLRWVRTRHEKVRLYGHIDFQCVPNHKWCACRHVSSSLLFFDRIILRRGTLEIQLNGGER